MRIAFLLSFGHIRVGGGGGGGGFQVFLGGIFQPCLTAVLFINHLIYHHNNIYSSNYTAVNSQLIYHHKFPYPLIVGSICRVQHYLRKIQQMTSLIQHFTLARLASMDMTILQW